MYNYNSPILNSIGPQYQNNLGPIGNVVPFGNVGYNNQGGYYNGIYNNYFNPYLAAEQQKLEQAKVFEEKKQQAGIMKTLAKGVYKGLDKEISDDFLNHYDPEMEGKNVDQEKEITNHLLELHNQFGFNSYNPRAYNAIVSHNRIYEKNKELYPDTMGIQEFNDISGLVYANQLEEKMKENQRNLSSLYNSKDYNKLLEQKGSFTYFNTLHNGGGTNQNINIDDMEIKLPNHVKSEFEERRRKFMESILNK